MLLLQQKTLDIAVTDTELMLYCVVGTTVNYFLDNRLNRADILFSGVSCFLVAVCLGSAVHSSNSADIEAKLGNVSGGCKTLNHEECQKLFGGEFLTHSVAYLSDSVKKTTHFFSFIVEDEEEEEMEKVKEGTAAFLLALENTRAIKVRIFLLSSVFLTSLEETE